MTCKNFIETQIIQASRKMVNKGFEYFSFILISQGIELLGSLYDTASFEDYGKSKTRFEKGIELFNHSFYKTQKKWLYENLRGSLIHQVRPNSEMILTSIQNGTKKEMHLSTYEGKKVFLIEELINDYEKAYKKLIKQSSLGGHNVNITKLNSDFLEIKSFNKDLDYPINFTGGTEEFTDKSS